MKLLKFSQVDAQTGISVLIERPRYGPVNPNISGLNIIFEYGDFRYSYVDDNVSANSNNLIFEITEQEFAQDIQDRVNKTLENWKIELYENEKKLRNHVLGKYDTTAIISGIYKYEDSLKFKQTGEQTPELVEEATQRGITVNQLADRIIENHETYRLKEAKIAGLRGKIYDRISSYSFDINDALNSWKELAERIEIIGTREPNDPSIDKSDNDQDVKIGYYYPNLSLRWKYLN